MKEFLASAGVPTARFGRLHHEDEALAFLSTMSPPYVIKTDGLARARECSSPRTSPKPDVTSWRN